MNKFDEEKFLDELRQEVNPQNKRPRPMTYVENIAFILHEEWRKTRRQADGTYEPRWKEINDPAFLKKFEGLQLPDYVRKNGEIFEIDIANATYNLLSADKQEENKAAAQVVEEIVNSKKNYKINKIGEIIHDAWLERNASWAKGGDLDVPFSELPKVEQDKDLVQYKVAKNLKNAELVTKYISTLDEVAEFLEQMYAQGKNVCYNFNGHMLYSMYDTKETAYMKVLGKTPQALETKHEAETTHFAQNLTQTHQKEIEK